jgi:hypothetical protein
MALPAPPVWSQAVSTPSPLEKKTDPSLDCGKPNRDPGCRPPAPARPYPYRRPVIINETQAAPPVDTSALKDDWDGCRSAKLSAMRSRDNGALDQANRLDDWLWKNCRGYSQELRDLEQDEM